MLYLILCDLTLMIFEFGDFWMNDKRLARMKDILVMLLNSFRGIQGLTLFVQMFLFYFGENISIGLFKAH